MLLVEAYSMYYYYLTQTNYFIITESLNYGYEV